MKTNALLLFVLLSFLVSCRPAETVKYGGWVLTSGNGCVSIWRDGKPLVNDMSAEYALGGKTISSRSYTSEKVVTRNVDDELGNGKKTVITYSGKGLPELSRTIIVLDDYILTDISLSAGEETETNYMAPAVIPSLGEHSAFDRALFVPFDNDAWIRYRSAPIGEMTEKLRSYEVTSIYNASTRKGVVLGAVEHDNWKNAVDMEKDGRVILFSGVADELTRDRAPHGMVKGKTVKSAMMMVGLFDDWRQGMETYADVNAAEARPREWDKAVPVGWNSWGTLQFNVNHDNATEVAEFFADELQPRSFGNSDGLTYIGLDSGWNSFTEDELKDFASTCKQHRQIPCIYWTPFTDWGKNPERDVPGAEEYKYRDIYLYADGQPEELDGAWAVDPTHPAVRRMMETTADLFRRCGYEYVKMDFMTHGRLEADSWYLDRITTGTQAYNYGMQLLDSIFHDMYLNLSISPIFPSQYAQSRRIACDAWNEIGHTEYTMNALSYGWWIDRVYNYNDADHVVLRDATEGENRARITSAVITGLFIIGDDFSRGGDEEVKNRARKYLTNPDINKIADGRSFRPLTGESENSENAFVRTEDNGDVYLAIFNYTEEDTRANLPLKRMGIVSADGWVVTELWNRENVDPGQAVTIPAKDAKVFLFKKQNPE